MGRRAGARRSSAPARPAFTRAAGSRSPPPTPSSPADRRRDSTTPLLDGEIVTMDEAGRPSFQLLAERMHVREPARAARAGRALPVSYLVFDVLRAAGGICWPAVHHPPRPARRPVAGASGRHPALLRRRPGDRGRAASNALEGVVAKRTGSHYQPGLRSPDWVKVKLEESCEFVVGGWRPGKRPSARCWSASPADGGLDLPRPGRRRDLRRRRTGAARRAAGPVGPQSPFAGTVPRRTPAAPSGWSPGSWSR